jgi:hypothetical protein
MVKKALVIGLLGIGMSLLVWSEASAKVCLVRTAGGGCAYWSGSVECQINANGVGNVLKTPTYLGCEASGNEKWVLGCGNPGSNNLLAPGANAVYATGILEGSVELSPEQVSQNGQASATAYAKPTDTFLEYLNANFLTYCPNPNWEIRDAVPCEMTAKDYLVEEIGNQYCITGEAVFDCTLPNCENLGVDPVTKTFERRQYSCEQVSSTNYNKNNYVCWDKPQP